jgi:hypothetical protein
MRPSSGSICAATCAYIDRRPRPALLVHDRTEHDSEVPVIELKTEEYEAGVRQRALYNRGDEVFVLFHSDEKIEIVVFCKHEGLRVFETPEQMIDKGVFRVGPEICVDGWKVDKIVAPPAKIDAWLPAYLAQSV